MNRIVMLALLTFSIPAVAQANDVYQRVVDNPDRPEIDLGRDASRQPLEILAFSELAPGQIIIELGAGGGYTTELAARVTGSEGHVYAHVLRAIRVEGNRLPNVTALPQHKLFELPKVLVEAGLKEGTADRVLAFFTVHDMYLNENIDMQNLYDDLLKMLKPGGIFIVLDNSAVVGTGLDDTPTYHRIDEEFVKAEAVKAGFEFVASSDVLRNPDDNRENRWNAPDNNFERGFQDRFALKLRKPR